MVLAGDPATNQVVFLAATHRPRLNVDMEPLVSRHRPGALQKRCPRSSDVASLPVDHVRWRAPKTNNFGLAPQVPGPPDQSSVRLRPHLRRI